MRNAMAETARNPSPATPHCELASATLLGRYMRWVLRMGRSICCGLPVETMSGLQQQAVQGCRSGPPGGPRPKLRVGEAGAPAPSCRKQRLVMWSVRAVPTSCHHLVSPNLGAIPRSLVAPPRRLAPSICAWKTLSPRRLFGWARESKFSPKVDRRSTTKEENIDQFDI